MENTQAKLKYDSMYHNQIESGESIDNSPTEKNWLKIKEVINSL